MKQNKEYTEIPKEGKLEVEPGAYLAMRREDARYKIALYYVSGFILIIFYVLTLYWITKMSIDNLTDLLITISGILSGPLGFIIGYYFKTHTKTDQ